MFVKAKVVLENPIARLAIWMTVGIVVDKLGIVSIEAFAVLTVVMSVYI